MDLYRIVYRVWSTKLGKGAWFCVERRDITPTYAVQNQRQPFCVVPARVGEPVIGFPEWEVHSVRKVAATLTARGQAAYDGYIAPGVEWLGRERGYAKRAKQPTVPMWVCVDCFVLLVNGDVSPECEDPDALLSKLTDCEPTPGMLREHHDCEEGTEECDCQEIPFSHSSCDGCGSPLYGERHAVTGWV